MEDIFFGQCLVSAIGVVVILLGLRVARRGRRLERAGVRTTAIVVEAGSDDEGAPFAVVEYQDQDQVWRHKRLMGHGRESPPVGSGARIVYDPLAPGHVDWEYNVDLWRGLALTVVGTGLFIAAIPWAPGWIPGDRPPPHRVDPPPQRVK